MKEKPSLLRRLFLCPQDRGDGEGRIKATIGVITEILDETVIFRERAGGIACEFLEYSVKIADGIETATLGYLCNRFFSFFQSFHRIGNANHI